MLSITSIEVKTKGKLQLILHTESSQEILGFNEMIGNFIFLFVMICLLLIYNTNLFIVSVFMYLFVYLYLF